MAGSARMGLAGKGPVWRLSLNVVGRLRHGKAGRGAAGLGMVWCGGFARDVRRLIPPRVGRDGEDSAEAQTLGGVFWQHGIC
jgi:hypothetical protein